MSDMKTLVLILLISLLSIVSIEQKTAVAMSYSGTQAHDLAKQCGAFDKNAAHFGEIINQKPKAFFQCAVDSDCVITKSVCFELISVARVAQQCFEKAVYEYSKTVNCLEVGGNQTADSKCMNNICTIQKQ